MQADSGFARFPLVSLVLVAIIGGCSAASPKISAPAPVRRHYAQPPSTMMTSCLTVLQHRGYLLTHSDSQLGLLTATRNAVQSFFTATSSVSIRIEPSGSGSDLTMNVSSSLVPMGGGAPIGTPDDSPLTESARQELLRDLAHMLQQD